MKNFELLVPSSLYSILQLLAGLIKTRKINSTESHVFSLLYQATTAFYCLRFSCRFAILRLYDVRFIPDLFSLSNAFSISQILANPIPLWLMENLGVENTVRTCRKICFRVSRMYEISISALSKVNLSSAFVEN